MRAIMKYDKFKFILNTIKEYKEKVERISDFMEKEVCTDSYCMINVGEELVNVLTSMLADEFDCWYYAGPSVSMTDLIDGKIKKSCEESTPENKWWNKSYRRWDNDIEYWLYEENKKIYIKGKEIPIDTEGQFYDYLVGQVLDKNKEK